MNVTNLIIIIFAATAYLILSLSALIYERHSRYSEDRRSLSILYNHAILGAIVLVVTALFVTLSLKHILLGDITPIYLIVLAFLILTLSIWTGVHPTTKGINKLSSAIHSGIPSKTFIYILQRLSLFCTFFFSYKGFYTLITTVFISVNKGLVAIGLIFADFLLFAICMAVSLKLISIYRARKVYKQLN